MYSRFLKFVVLFFVSTFSICSSVAASIFYDFSKIDGFDKWDTSYKERVVEYDEGIVTFNRANHQSNKQPINTIPVVNRKNNSDNNDITFVLKGKGTINSLSLTCRQWNTYELKVLLYTSTDGGATYSDTKISTTINGKDSVLEAKDLVKVNAVKFAFSNKNNVGIASLSLVLSDYESVPSHAVSYYVNGELMQRDSIKEGDSFNLPEPTGVPQGVPFMGWTTTPLEGMQEMAPSMVSKSEMGTSDMAFHAVFATLESIQGKQWKKMSVSELFTNHSNGTYAIVTSDGCAFDGNINISNKKYQDAVVTSEAFDFDDKGRATSAPEGTCELMLSFTGDNQVVIKNESTNQVLTTTTTGDSRKLEWKASESNKDYWYLDDGNLRSGANDSYLRTYTYNKSIRAYRSPSYDCICFVYKAGTSYTDYCTKITTRVVVADCGYTTVCLPYNAVAQEGAHLYALRSIDEKGLHFVSVDTLRANQGFLVQGNAGETITLTKVSDSCTDIDNLMGGVVERTLRNCLTLQGSGEYAYPWILAKDGTFKRYTGEYIPAGKAYVDGALIQRLSSNESANTLRILFEDDETTGVRFLVDAETSEVFYYNLQGQRIARPTHPGTLYIERDNRKCLMK